MTKDEKKGVVTPLPSSYRTQDFDLANVTPEQVRSILRNVRTGRLEDQDRLFRLMLDSWSRLRKCLNEVSGAVASLPIMISPAIREGEEEPTPEALRIHEVVERALESYAPRPAYLELDGMGMIKAMVDAYAKGISVVEILWHTQNGVVSPRCFCPVPAKYLAYPQDSNQTDRLMVAPNGVAQGVLEDFPADKFLIGIWQQGGIHPIHCGNLRALTKQWLGAIYGMGWLMQYAQLFGIPWRHIETDGSAEAMSKAQDLLEGIGSSGAAVTGPNVKLSVLEGVSGSAATMPQSHLMDIADKACDILMLGQTLTTDVGASGSRALGDVHASVRSDILQSVATWVSGIYTNQLIPAIVTMNFGKVASEDLPYATLEIPVPKDQKAIAERLKIISEIGLPVTLKWAYEEMGIPEPQEGDTLLGEAPPQMEMPDPIVPDPITPAPEEDAPEDAPEDLIALDLMPTAEMAQAAQAALDARRIAPIGQRGMTAAGLQRARDIAAGVELTQAARNKMKAFFSTAESGEVGSKQWQTYQGWGGDAGKEWSSK
jgi:phage gp29-like protein